MLFFDSILKADKLEGLHFIMCLSAMTLIASWNVAFAKMSTLCCFGFQGCREQDDNAWRYFLRKILEKNKCLKVDFLQIKHFFRDELCKASSESWQYRGLPAPLISSVSIHSRWTAMWIVSVPKMTNQTKKPYFDPCMNKEKATLLKLICRR